MVEAEAEGNTRKKREDTRAAHYLFGRRAAIDWVWVEREKKRLLIILLFFFSFFPFFHSTHERVRVWVWSCGVGVRDLCVCLPVPRRTNRTNIEYFALVLHAQLVLLANSTAEARRSRAHADANETQKIKKWV